MKFSTEKLTGNALTWATAMAAGWEPTNSEALRRIRFSGGEEVEDILMPGDDYPGARADISVLRDRHGDFVEIPEAWA